MEYFKTVIVKWVEAAMTKDKVREWIVLWPMIAWGFLIGLAETALLTRGGVAAQWAKGTIVPIADFAPMAVLGGEVMGTIFCVILAVHVFGLIIYKKIRKLTPAQKTHNDRLLESEQILIVIVLGITSIFAVPYRPDVPGCMWSGGCKNPGEAYLVTGIMTGYLAVVVAELAKKLKRLARLAEISQEEKVRTWIEGSAQEEVEPAEGGSEHKVITVER
jgi:hypothetical protein